MTHDYFSGSYSTEDVRFLLKPIRIENTPVKLKEALIQAGKKHYSQMLTHEKRPSQDYLDLFRRALSDNRTLVARHALILAKRITETRRNGIVLVSLMRAGTPVGVLLKRMLGRYFGVDADHYSISIIRDVGIDENALRHILARHAPDSLVFVDGWTGKGVISRQLEISLKRFADKHGIVVPPELYVLSDLAGTAFVSASAEDYLIPSSILNATVSGLVSRSVIDEAQLLEADYHGCHFYRDYADADLSRDFVDSIMSAADDIMAQPASSRFDPEPRLSGEALREQARRFLAWVRDSYGVADQNLIKPGIGESTRVFLRREADLLLVRERGDPAVQHLLYLAEAKSRPIKACPDLPYRAVALIKKLK